MNISMMRGKLEEAEHLLFELRDALKDLCSHDRVILKRKANMLYCPECDNWNVPSHEGQIVIKERL